MRSYGVVYSTFDYGQKMTYTALMGWKVVLNNRSAKNYKKLPESIKDSFDTLVCEIMEIGPVRGNWRHYSKLSSIKHHCHLTPSKRKPTYVACWAVINKEHKLVEVYYVGTHEKAPY